MKKRVVVIGGGIAGISTAARISHACEVVIVEQVFQPAYHSTGRSAAVLHKPFENDIVYRMSCIAEEFFLNPPKGFANLAGPLLHLVLGQESEANILEEFLHRWHGPCPWLRMATQDELHDRVPILDDSINLGVADEQSLKLDVNNIVDGFRRLLMENGGSIRTNARVEAIENSPAGWRLCLADGAQLEADVIVNAAGAWADHVASLLDVAPINLQPKRRTVVLVDPKMDISNWPMCYRAAKSLYFKPEGSMLLVSPADQTPSEPCDAQPEMLDIAITIERLMETTTLHIDRPEQTWAGLRSFVSDGAPVIGYDAGVEDFFWVAALGGFGIQTSPAYSQLAADLLLHEHPMGELGRLAEELAVRRQTSILD